jgi:hypothetical protein
VSAFVSRSASPSPLMAPDYAHRAASPASFGYPYTNSMRDGYFDAPQPTAIRGWARWCLAVIFDLLGLSSQYATLQIIRKHDLRSVAYRYLDARLDPQSEATQPSQQLKFSAYNNSPAL